MRYFDVHRLTDVPCRTFLHVRATRRCGLSLIEVLISILVVTVGLLGIASLLPIAQHDVKQGTLNDQKFLVAKRAWRDIRIRGFNQPSNWVYLGTNGDMYTEVFNSHHGSWFNENGAGPIEINMFRSFVIDPWFAATHDTTTDNQKKYFPYTLNASGFSPDLAIKQRFTVRANPFQVPINGSKTSAGKLTPPNLAVAQQLYMCQDDLVFEVPEDADALPLQVLTTDETKRQYDGRYSWMMTVVPVQIGLFNQQGLFRVSVVVFRDRIIPSDLSNNLYERVVDLRTLGGGFGGGDVLLKADNEQDLDGIDDGEWLMLILPQGFASYTIPNSIDRWYKVDHVAAEPYHKNDNWFLEATLAGPDFDEQNLPGGVARAVIMDNAVAVYEKTMPFDLTSSWDFK